MISRWKLQQQIENYSYTHTERKGTGSVIKGMKRGWRGVESRKDVTTAEIMILASYILFIIFPGMIRDSLRIFLLLCGAAC
jgi:hypothetical protein